MSESEGCDVNCTCKTCKGKKRVIRIEESSDSDSPVEQTSKRKKAPRVLSDGAATSSESDSFYEVARKKKRRGTPRVISDEEDNCNLVPSNRNRASEIMSETESSSDGDETGSNDSECDEIDEDYVGSSSSSSGWQSDWASHDEEVEEEGDDPERPQPVAEVLHSEKMDFDSDSSDGTSEKCPICLRALKMQEIGTPESCEHHFCVMCLQEWAKNINTCPVDRQTFTRILVRRHLSGEVSRHIAVEAPVAHDHDDDIVEDPTFCETCQRSDREDRMLLCDGCDSGYHLECLNPPLVNVPIEQWFCPECVLSNSMEMSGEADMGAEELIDLIDDAQTTIGHSPLRPRVQRLLPRTRASERVRDTIRTRVRTEAANQPSTSSGIESQESASRLAGFFGGRPLLGARKKPTKRKIRRKVKRRKRARTTKSNTSGRERASTSCGTRKSTTKKRATKKKKSGVRRKGRRKVKVAPLGTVKRRLAEQLGLRAPKKAGQLLPQVRAKHTSMVHRNLAPTLHIHGPADELVYFSSGSDVEGGGGMGGLATANRARTSASRIERNLVNRKLLSPGAIRSHSSIVQRPPNAANDLISSILDSQAVWHSKKAVVSINRDRTFTVKKDGRDSLVRSDPVAVKPPTAVDVNDSNVNGTQAPMYPGGRGSSGDGRGAPYSGGGGFQNNDQRYNSSGAYQGGGNSNGPQRPPPAGFDFRDNRAGYTDYLRGGAPMPFRGSPPVRFRMPARFPLRPPFPRRGLPTPSFGRPSEDAVVDEGGWKSSTDDNEDDEIDIYSDIEVAEVAGNDVADAEYATQQQQTATSNEQAASDDGSDTELIIDDNATQAASPAAVPDSDKYDPAEPCSDSNSSDLVIAPDNKVTENATTASETTQPAAVAPDVCKSEAVSTPSNNLDKVPDNYLQSPTYEDSNSRPADKAVSDAVKEVLKVHLEASNSATEGRHSNSSTDNEDDCPNFSIYSAASMDIAIARTTEMEPETSERGLGDIEPTVDEAELEDIAQKKEDAMKKELDNYVLSQADKVASGDANNSVLSETENLACHLEEGEEEELKQALPTEKDFDITALADKEHEIGLAQVGLVDDIFASDEESLVGGATSPVSAVSSAHTPTQVRNTGLEGLETEAISETDEANHFDELSETSFATVEEDGEISPKKRKKRQSQVVSGDEKEGQTPPRDPVDYEEGEIVDERPKKDKKKAVDKRADEEKVEGESKVSDENVDTTKKSSKSSEDDKKKKKKKPTEKRASSKDRSVLGSKENKEKSRDRSNRDDPNIAWKKPNKAKERNYRDGKDKPDKTAKEKEVNKKRHSSKEKESSSSRKDKDKEKEKEKEKERKKKDKRQDMERYNVRKMVTNKKRGKRRDEFGRDLSRDRSYTRSHSRSPSYDKTRVRSRTPSKTRSNRGSKRSPAKPPRKRSRSVSRGRSRSSKSRHRSRSRSRRNRSKLRTKSKDMSKRTRSKDRPKERPKRYSPIRPRNRKHTRSRSRSRNRSRIRTRSKTPLRSRARLATNHVADIRGPPLRSARRSQSRGSWSPTYSRSGSASGSSYSRSPSSTSLPRGRQLYSYSKSYSRSWTPEPRVPVAGRKSGNINKSAKKLTVTVTNTKEAPKKKKKKVLKKKDMAAPERRKKRKDKSPAPSKEVFTSGDNILVSVNFNKSSKGPSKDSGNIAGIKDTAKRKLTDDGNRDGSKKLRKDKSKDKAAPKGIQARLGARKKGPKLSRVAAAAKRKPMAIIDLDQSPFREQTPSPQDLIVLSDSEDEIMNKQGGEAADRRVRENSNSPKGSSKAGTNTATNVSESQSPIMSGIGSYLVTSTGPKTPPEPQVKFSIAAKATLRSIMNPLQEEDDEEDEEEDLADDIAMDNIDRRIEEELNRSEPSHKGPNTPPEPRGPSTPPTSPDAYDPFEPTKSGSASPAGPDADRPASANTPAVGASPKTDGAAKASDAKAAPAEESSEKTKSPEVSLLVDLTKKSPVVVSESPKSAVPTAAPTQSQESEPEKTTAGAEPATISPKSAAPAHPPKPSPAKQFAILKPSPTSQQPTATSASALSAAATAPIFPALTSANIASMLRTPPPSVLPIRVSMYNQPPPNLPLHHHIQFLGSPIVPRSLPPVVEKPKPLLKTTPLKLSPQKTSTPVKPSPQKATPLRPLNGDPKPQDKSTDVVDMELESPYSPASSEANDLFEPPVDLNKHATRSTPKRGAHKTPTKNSDKFDVIFGESPMPRGNNKGGRGGKFQAKNNNKTKAGAKHDGKAKGKKEIGIKMNEDKLQILDELPSSAVELQVKDKYLKKLNRQERVVEEVKLTLKPHYAKKHITKEEYKDILRRSVPKICHNRSGEINPIKIASLVEAYVKKVRYNKKKGGGGGGKTKAKTQMWS